MRKRNFTSLEVLAEQVREAELQIFASKGRAEAREQNFTCLAVKAERKCGCGSGTSHFWQSMQNESADVELQIFASQGRAEMWKRNIWVQNFFFFFFTIFEAILFLVPLLSHFNFFLAYHEPK